jgi:hypothetical protein
VTLTQSYVHDEDALTADATHTLRFSLWDAETVGTGPWCGLKRTAQIVRVKSSLTLEMIPTGLDGVDFSQQY